jgi:hypothetical protein
VASELIELSTRHHFAQWLAAGQTSRGWVRSVAGDTTVGISWIEDGIENWRATGTTLTIPFSLAGKAEALHLADRTSEALEAISEAEALVERSEERCGLLNCTGSEVCFSRLLAQTRPKLRRRSTMPSESHSSRSPFRWRNARKQPTQNTVAKRQVRQENVDSNCLFVDAKRKNDLWSRMIWR